MSPPPNTLPYTFASSLTSTIVVPFTRAMEVKAEVPEVGFTPAPPPNTSPYILAPLTYTSVFPPTSPVVLLDSEVGSPKPPPYTRCMNVIPSTVTLVFPETVPAYPPPKTPSTVKLGIPLELSNTLDVSTVFDASPALVASEGFTGFVSCSISSSSVISAL